MNHYLAQIKKLVEDASLPGDAAQALLKALSDADKQWAMTDFKLDRTEKVKRTTAILLEETIEELEQKRKAVEGQNRELEIEAALEMERVRAIAISMNKPDDILDACKNHLATTGIAECKRAPQRANGDLLQGERHLHELRILRKARQNVHHRNHLQQQ